jgi:hypothetical protein
LAKYCLTTLLYFAVAGCQPVPQPFAHPEKSINPIVVPTGDFGGVTLLPVSGLTYERGRGLTAAMTDALLSQGIIAAPDSSNQRSKFLQGAVTKTAADGTGTRVTIIWDLFDGGGKFLGSREATLALPQNYWLKDNKKTLRRLVKGVAAELAQLVRGENDGATAKSRIALRIGIVKGVSDKATTSLRRAMEDALKKRNFRISDAFEGTGLVITGAIKLGPENADPRPIRIIWSVLDPAGKELGKLTQQNTIPRQELEKKWNSLAVVIADNAAGGVGDLVVQLPRNVLGSDEISAK